MSNSETTLNAVTQVKEHSGWFIALGVAFLIGGVFAIAMPLVASFAVTLAVGWALIFVGVLQLIHSWSIRTWGGFALQVVIGLIILAGGIGILVDPIVATVSLTLLLGAVFAAKGIVQVVLAGMSANLCVESHLRSLLEGGFEVAVVRDATAAAILPEGDGYLAALTNFRFMANAVWTTAQAVDRFSGKA